MPAFFGRRLRASACVVALIATACSSAEADVPVSAPEPPVPVASQIPGASPEASAPALGEPEALHLPGLTGRDVAAAHA
ncbi:MAG TPA: hypothetical protein VML96_09330, partial [Egibacteraceae bacterium]|nr:hypothetical protein [Egibacteraceae bacterium]